jgi:hypothetical protein
MKKLIARLLVIIFALIYVSCSFEDKAGGEDVVFMNFSPLAVQEIKAYAVQSARIPGTYEDEYIKNECVYTYNGDIPSDTYFIFTLPVSSLPDKRFHLEVRTSDSNVYTNSNLTYFYHYGSIATEVIFSVDFDLIKAR